MFNKKYEAHLRSVVIECLNGGRTRKRHLLDEVTRKADRQALREAKDFRIELINLLYQMVEEDAIGCDNYRDIAQMEFYQIYYIKG